MQSYFYALEGRKPGSIREFLTNPIIKYNNFHTICILFHQNFFFISIIIASIEIFTNLNCKRWYITYRFEVHLKLYCTHLMVHSFYCPIQQSQDLRVRYGRATVGPMYQISVIRATVARVHEGPFSIERDSTNYNAPLSDSTILNVL